MDPGDGPIWKRVVERRRQDCASLDEVVANTLVRGLPALGSGMEAESPPEQIELHMNVLYNIASDGDRKPEDRRRAYEGIQDIRRRLDEALTRQIKPTPSSASKPINGEKNAEKDVTAAAVTTNKERTTSIISTKPATLPPQAASKSSNQSYAKEKAATTTAASAPTKPSVYNSETLGTTHISNAPAFSSGFNGKKDSTANARKQKPSFTATLAATSASTSAQAASSSDAFPSKKTSSSEVPQKVSQPVNKPDPPPYQRTSTTVAGDKAKKTAKQASNPKNGTHPMTTAPTTSNPLSAENAASSSTISKTNGILDSKKRRWDQQQSNGMDIPRTDDNGNPKSAHQKPPDQDPPRKAAKANEPPKPLPSSFTLDTSTISTSTQANFFFQADRKDKGSISFSCSQKERLPVRAYFRKTYASDEMLMGSGRLLEMWEPYWQVERIIASGVTSRIEKLAWARPDSKSPTTPHTAAMMELSTKILSNKEFNNLSWGTKQNTILRPKDGDRALLLRMLPIQVDANCKNKRANCHLWPKGTFLTIDGQPIQIIQRKQASHDHKKWEFLCQPLDLAPHIDLSDAKKSHTVAMCCHDEAQYVFILALCSFKSPTSLTKRLMEPNNNFLERLSYEESVEKAMKHINQHSVVIDDDSSSGNDVGKLIFSLVDPVTKVPMKIPVRGRGCRHFQCFDLESYMILNASVSGGRWRCLCCENFITYQELQVCGLTQQALSRFAKTASSVRDRVMFRADKTYELLPEQEGKFAKRRAQTTGKSGSSPTTPKQQQEKHTNSKGNGGAQQPIEVIELD